MHDFTRTWISFEWIYRLQIREWVENKESSEHSGYRFISIIICDPSSDLFQQLLRSIFHAVVPNIFRGLNRTWRDSKSTELCGTRYKTSGKFDRLRNVQPLRLLAISYLVWNVINYDWRKLIEIGHEHANGNVDPSFPSIIDSLHLF